MSDWVILIALVMRFAWVVAVFGVTTYLVFWQGHSGWWFLLAILLAGGAGEQS